MFDLPPPTPSVQVEVATTGTVVEFVPQKTMVIRDAGIQAE